MHDTMKRFLILSAAALLAVSCFRGPVVSRNLDLRDFTAVRVADGADVTFTQADSFSVALRTRKGVIDTVDCKVIDGELYIGTKGHRPLGARKFSLEVSAPVLSRVHVMEASSFSGGCSSDENLTVSAEKTGKVSLDGVRCKNLYVLFPGTGTVSARNLDVRNCLKVKMDEPGTLKLGGSTSDAVFEVNAPGSIDARGLKASGNVRRKTSGGAKIKM